MSFSTRTLNLPSAEEALPGRSEAIEVSERHYVLGTPMRPPFLPSNGGDVASLALFGLGCFWGAERLFWKMPGVVSTQVGYAAGLSENPTYRDVCTGRTGHNEVVRVAFDPSKIAYEALLRAFFEAHDPTQGMRQGNDVGTQYRSGIYVYDEGQREAAESAKRAYQIALRDAGRGEVTTEILDAPPFYYAEDYHQQYLAKNPSGYCGIGGTGVAFPAEAEGRS